MEISSVLWMSLRFPPYNGTIPVYKGERIMETAQLDPQATLPQTDAGPVPAPPRRKKKWLRWLFLALAVLLAAWWFLLRPRGSAPLPTGQYLPAPAAVRDLTAAVSGSGAVRPVESYEVGALASGEILSAPFEVGDQIQAGALLYQLDAGDAQASLEQAQLTLRQAQMSYDQLAEALAPAASVAGVVQEVHVQKGDLVSAGTAIADITDTSAMKVTLPFQSADAAGIVPGQSAQVTLSGTLETLPGTVESVSTADLVGAGGALVRQVTIRVDNPGALTAGGAATASVGNISCAGSGTFEALSRQTVVAQTSGEVLSLSVSAGDRVAAGDVLAQLGGTAADNALADAAMAVESAQLSLRRAQEALEDYTITSPISGTVIEKNFKAGDKMDGMEAGALAVIYDLSALELELRVSELDIGSVQPGQEVVITAEALPGETFTGRVERVSINGSTTDGFTTYPVTILLEDFGGLNPGMNVSADIIISRTEDALCVPVEAVDSSGAVLVAGPGVLTEDGSAVADLSKAERREVTLGAGDEDYVEITSGLEEGELVLVPVQSAGGGLTAIGG